MANHEVYVVQGKTLDNIAGTMRAVLGVDKDTPIRFDEVASSDKTEQINTDIETQTDLIAQIKTALNGKAGSSAAEIGALIDQSGVLGTTDETVTVTEKVEQLIDKAEYYDDFWDAYQKNGTRTNYEYAFQSGWTNDNFNPKYNIEPLVAGSMFRGCGEIDIIQRLKDNNVTFDVSNSTNLSYLFYSGGVTTVPTIEIPSNMKAATHMFYGCRKLHTIEKIVYHSEYDSRLNFDSCIALQNFIVEGEIGKSFYIKQSSKLTPESVQSIFNCLSSTVTGQTLTLPPAFENADTEAVVSANIELVDGVTQIKGKEGWTLVR